MNTNLSSNFKEIVIKEIPLIDVRAPIEFLKGAFINSVNLPLMNDEERRLIGICFKEKGREEAIKLGHKLVSGNVRQQRIDDWVSQIKKYPDSMIYCFRGGLRSSISQQWIIEATGKEITRIDGGYKAFRNYLINALKPENQSSIPIMLGGYTGSGKTGLIRKLNNSIDLEGIANHRGSSFGRFVTPQPTQINFENNLAYALIKHKDSNNKYMILENEGQNIGKNFIPKPLFEYFNSGDLVIVDVSFEERLENTINEYVIYSQSDYIKEFGEDQGLLEWYNYISNSINKIKKRLGGELYSRVLKVFDFAFNHQKSTGNKDLHEEWVQILLKEYYDTMYSYQIQKNTKKILFRGDSNQVLRFLTSL